MHYEDPWFMVLALFAAILLLLYGVSLVIEMIEDFKYFFKKGPKNG